MPIPQQPPIDRKARKVRRGYRTYDLRSWVCEIDTGCVMLKCPDCGCRVIMEPYLKAIGTDGTKHCPYCGAKR